MVERRKDGSACLGWCGETWLFSCGPCYCCCLLFKKTKYAFIVIITRTLDDCRRWFRVVFAGLVITKVCAKRCVYVDSGRLFTTNENTYVTLSLTTLDRCILRVWCMEIVHTCSERNVQIRFGQYRYRTDSTILR